MDRDVLRKLKEAAYEEKCAELYLKHPQLKDINAAIQNLSMQILKKCFINKSYQENHNKEMNTLLEKRNNYLKENKLENFTFQPDWNCKKCQDKGYLSPGVACDCLKQDIYNRTFISSGIIGRMKEMCFDNFDISYYKEPNKMMTKVLRCKNFIANIICELPQNNLFFRGGVGRGKTHLSVAIGNKLLLSGKTVIYMRAPDLFDILRENKYQDYENRSPAGSIPAVNEVDLLIIDDLGTESVTPFSENQLKSIIEDRNNTNKPWIINSNLSLDELQEKYGQRITDRIIEKTDFFVFETDMSIREILRRKHL